MSVLKHLSIGRTIPPGTYSSPAEVIDHELIINTQFCLPKVVRLHDIFIVRISYSLLYLDENPIICFLDEF
jgi:hypothetical protein